MGGGANAVTAGGSPSYRCTSTSVVWALQHCASLEVPLSRVSTLGLPHDLEGYCQKQRDG
jgi:hypothetical protein